MTIIDASTPVNSWYGVKLRDVSGVTFEGFTIKKVGVYYNEALGIALMRASGCTISNNRIIEFTTGDGSDPWCVAGIDVTDSSNNVVIDNYCSVNIAFGDGICLYRLFRLLFFHLYKFYMMKNI